MRINEDNMKALPGDSKVQATTTVRALPENSLFLLLLVSSPLFLCFCLLFFFLLTLCSPLLSSSVRLLFFFLFVFPCFLNPCDEEQRTVLASPFEFGSGFLLCVWLVFSWFFLCFSGFFFLVLACVLSFFLPLGYALSPFFFISVFLFSTVRGLFFPFRLLGSPLF